MTINLDANRLLGFRLGANRAALGGKLGDFGKNMAPSELSAELGGKLGFDKNLLEAGAAVFGAKLGFDKSG